MERVPRVNQLIKKELNRIILREIDFPKDALVTITRVESSSNLIQVRVYVSVMPENKTGQVMSILSRDIYSIQQGLNKRLRMRPIPKIIFVEESTVREAAKIEEILEEIHKKDV